MHVNILVWRIGATFAALFFGACMIGAYLSGQYIPALVFILFFLPSLFLVVGYGPIALNTDGISMTAPVGTYAIRWDEVRRIRHAKSHLLFEGEGKRLTVPMPSFWNGKSKNAAIAVLDAFIRDSGITPTYSVSADFLISKNTKIR